LQVVRDAWTYWQNSLRAESTRKGYARGLKKVLKYWGLTPQQVFELRTKHVNSSDFFERRTFEDKTREFLRETERSMGGGAQRNCYQAVNSFFSVLDMPWS